MDPDTRAIGAERSPDAFFGTKPLAAHYRRGFPRSPDQAPVLLPTPNTTVRNAFELWFRKLEITPRLAAEFEDTALLKVFGGAGIGLFQAPTAIEAHVKKQYGANVIVLVRVGPTSHTSSCIVSFINLAEG